MERYYQDYYDLYSNLHTQMEAVVSGLPQEALDWQPGEGMNSIAVLAMHTAGAARFLLGDVVMGVDSQRNREVEFQTQGRSAEELTAGMQLSLRTVKKTLEQLDLAEMEACRASPRDGRELTVGWCLAHALEHTAQHLGHMQITRQMWEQINT